MTIRETVEYCQWNEVISENGEVKYEKGWFDKVIPSNKFKKSHEYYNPNRTDIDGKLLYDVVYIYDIK